MKKTTISKAIKAILNLKNSEIKLAHEDVREETFKRLANEVAIIGKMLFLMEEKGESSAMGYYMATHHGEEYLGYICEDEIEAEDAPRLSLCESCWCMTNTVQSLDGQLYCAKCGGVKRKMDEASAHDEEKKGKQYEKIRKTPSQRRAEQ